MTNPPVETILVVYDSQTIRDTVSVVGIDSEFRVVELADPDQLPDALDTIQPDLAILCAMTKRTNAYEACNRIKTATAGSLVPVVIYALKVDLEQRGAAYAAGADDIVEVTMKSDGLLYRIRSLLRMRRLVMEYRQRTVDSARASAEAADVILQLEEADRRIREQNKKLASMVRQLEKRDQRIQRQQQEIAQHLATLKEEMAIASALQVNLLPTVYPAVADLLLYDRYIPAADLCGDYYDYMSLEDGTFVISIADVTGHGVAPALVSVQVRTMARSAIRTTSSPAAVLAELNTFMVETFNRDFLMSMIILSHQPGSDEVIFAGAGHCPMMLIPAGDGPCSEFFSTGVPLGGVAQATYRDGRVPLLPGDRLLLYTDGITDVSGRKDGELFGVAQLQEVVDTCRQEHGRDVLDRLVRAAKAYSAADAFCDDVTLILLEREGAPHA